MEYLSNARIRNARSSVAAGEPLERILEKAAPTMVGVRDVVGADSQLRSAVTGAGPYLQPLLDDHQVTDVLVNGIDGVWVDRGGGLEPIPGTEKAFPDIRAVRGLAMRLAAAAGQRLDDQSPIVDGTLSGGVRLHAVLPPLASRGPLISLRVHRRVTFSLEELVHGGMILPELQPVVSALVTSRANVMISGSTGSGKTTLLSGLIGIMPPSERILIMEESEELHPSHPHVVHLQERRANVQGIGAVDMTELVRAAMRMRPDRLVLGECRGAEVRDVLAALNTGHEGGWATIHANSAVDVPARLVALGALAGMSEHAVTAQAYAALDAIVHVERRAGMRVLTQIAVLSRAGNELRAEDALTVEAGGLQIGPGWNRLARRIGMGAASSQGERT